MDSQLAENKVYVALGNDLQDGFKTLDWTLKKWNSQPISIIILHATCNLSHDFVYTPFGKLPARVVNDEKMEVLKKYEKEKTDKLLSKYISFCGEVKAELLEVEKCDNPIHKVIVDSISGHRITKLVMGFSFLKSSSWKIKNAISGSFYVHKNKPDFCEIFIICGGKQLSIRGSENNKGIMEDDQGVTVARVREKGGFKDWLGKIFIPNPSSSLERNQRRILSSSAINLDSPSTQSQWQNYAQEIEDYFQHLLSLYSDDEEVCVQEDDCLQQSPRIESGTPEHADCDLVINQN